MVRRACARRQVQIRNAPANGRGVSKLSTGYRRLVVRTDSATPWTHDRFRNKVSRVKSVPPTRTSSTTRPWKLSLYFRLRACGGGRAHRLNAVRARLASSVAVAASRETVSLTCRGIYCHVGPMPGMPASPAVAPTSRTGRGGGDRAPGPGTGDGARAPSSGSRNGVSTTAPARP